MAGGVASQVSQSSCEDAELGKGDGLEVYDWTLYLYLSTQWCFG